MHGEVEHLLKFVKTVLRIRGAYAGQVSYFRIVVNIKMIGLEDAPAEMTVIDFVPAERKKLSAEVLKRQNPEDKKTEENSEESNSQGATCPTLRGRF